MTLKELIDVTDENLGIELYANNQINHNPYMSNPQDMHYGSLYPKEPIPENLKEYLNYIVVKIEHHWDECIIVTIEKNQQNKKE